MKIYFLNIFFLLTVFFSNGQNCNKIPFYPANHIRNPSLEQVPGSCVTQIYNLPNQTPMSSIIPFWQIPISNYTGITYFGQCNNFTLWKDPQDFINNPNMMPTYQPLVPLPIPDGNGVLGFLSDRSKNGSSAVDTFRGKEYICTNLLRPLKKDSLYRLSFYLGFGIKDTAGIPYNNGIYYYISASPTKFELFGLVDSTHIPFPKPQGNHGAFGCLSQINNEWISLGTCILSGNPGTWVEGTIEFTSPANLQSIGIGPACDLSDVPYTTLGNNERSYYYFLDNLQFYQASAPKPILELVGGSFCDGPNASATLHMKSDNYYAGSQLQWYKNNVPINETSGTITITKNQYGEGWYQCGVENDTVCIRSDSFHVYWDPMIADRISSDPDTTACSGETVSLTINGGANASYLWNNGSYSSSITVTQSGTYSVQASNACNSVTATKNIQFKECPPTLYIPSAFTPNHDGLNDVFRVLHTGTLQSFQFSVFNRWGRRVFFTKDITKGWDATFNNTPQASGMYVWMVQYSDNKGTVHIKKGTVALIR